MKKRSMALVLTLVMCVGLMIAIPALALPSESLENPSAGSTQNATTVETGPMETTEVPGAGEAGPGGPESRAVKWAYQNEPLDSSKATQIFSYELSRSYPFAKIYIKNNSTEYKLSSSQSYLSPTTGGFGETRYVKPNGDIIIYIYSRGNDGEYYTSITGENGTPLNGYISIRLASTEAELD